MAKTTSKNYLRDLPKETQHEIAKRNAKIAQAKVDKAEAQNVIDKNRDEIQKLREG